jgi:peroxiredoxin
VTGFPETFVLDRDGRVVEAFAGAVNTDEDKERLGSAIERALGQ